MMDPPVVSNFRARSKSETGGRRSTNLHKKTSLLNGNLQSKKCIDHTPVKLLKFGPYESLTTGKSIGVNFDKTEESDSNQQDATPSMEPKSLSTSELVRKSEEKNQKTEINRSDQDIGLQEVQIAGLKWPVSWFNQSSLKKDQDDGNAFLLSTLSNGKSATDLASNVDHREPFQVIWRRLAFEPNLSTYDRLLSCSLIEHSRRILGNVKRKSDIFSKDIESRIKPYDGTRRNQRVIFQNLNGHINSHELTAILGPSGSGKTSLLNAICGQTENYRGLIELRGLHSSKQRLRLSIIPQKDYLIENLTVWENLQYSSKILNSDPGFQHEQNIMNVVQMLKLTNCLDSSVANISGGEYKRVSIAQELLKQPDILILDEPTSGLDSLNCKNLIKSLVKLTEASRKGNIEPISIVMTIHQPDVEVFHMFDHVYCMAKRGRVIFDGRPRDTMAVIRDKVGHLLPPSREPSVISEGSSESPEPWLNVNPANLLIEIASEDIYGPEPIEQLAKYQLQQFERAYSETLKDISEESKDDAKSEVNQLNDNMALGNITPKIKSLISFHRLDDLASNKTNLDVSNLSDIQAQKAETHLVRDKQLDTSKSKDNDGKFWYHTSLLTRRAFKSTIRDPLMTVISILFHLSIPFVMWIVYNRETGSVKACPIIQREMELLAMVQNSTLQLLSRQQHHLITALECSTMFFLSTYSFSMCSLSIAALAFPLNMHVLLKETRNGWYSLPSFVVAKTLASFLFEVLFPVTSLVMIYLMLGMPSSEYNWRLWAIAAVIALISMLAHTQGLIFGALCMDSVQTAIFLASSLTLPQTVLSGFTARIEQMPEMLQKLSWLSMYRYSSDSINMIRFGFGLCECDETTEEYLKAYEPTFLDAPKQMQNILTYHLSNVYENVTLLDQRDHVPGVNYELTLNSTTRRQMLERLESKEVDIFSRMAQLTVQSLSYGRTVNDCNSVRSQLLTTVSAPDDNKLPYLFAGMIVLLILMRILLLIVVKCKLSNRM